MILFPIQTFLKAPISDGTFVTNAYLFQDNAHLGKYHIHTKLHAKLYSEISPNTNVFQNSEMSRFTIRSLLCDQKVLINTFAMSANLGKLNYMPTLYSAMNLNQSKLS